MGRKDFNSCNLLPIKKHINLYLLHPTSLGYPGVFQQSPWPGLYFPEGHPTQEAEITIGKCPILSKVAAIQKQGQNMLGFHSIAAF